MTVDDNRALARKGGIAAAARIVERAGYLADESVFNLVRAGIADAVARHRVTVPVHVCHSLGCFVGLDAASREPGAIVIAINMPASPWHGFRRAAGVVARMTQIARREGIAEASQFRDSYVYFGRPGMDDLKRQRLKRIRRHVNHHVTPRRQDTALFLRTVMLEHRPKGSFQPRVLLVQGGRDPIAPAHHAKLLRNRLPYSALVTIDGAHVLPVTHPLEVVRAVEGFLAAEALTQPRASSAFHAGSRPTSA
jgi:pimeloyl-ACP methyl ester carboxylesterase